MGPAYKDTRSSAYHSKDFPKNVGQPGQCFTKCKDVPRFMMFKWLQVQASYRTSFSCRFAKALGCKTPDGNNKVVGYIPFKKAHQESYKGYTYNPSTGWVTCPGY